MTSIVRSLAVFAFVFVTAVLPSTFVFAKEEGGETGGPVGYGGAIVQMTPFVTPYRDRGHVHFKPLLVRLVLDAGPNGHPACFVVPKLHDRMLQYLYKANLTADDFTGERSKDLAKALFDVAIDMVGKGYYTDVQIVGPDTPPLDGKSQTLSVQCR